MTMSAEELRAMLGLSSNEEPSTWVERARPRDAVTRGLSLGATVGLSEELLRGLEENPVFHPEPQLETAIPGTTTWDGDPFVLRFVAPVISAKGAFLTRLGETIVDTSAGESTLVVSTDAGRVVVHAEQGVVRVLRGALPFDYHPPASPKVDVPSLAHLLGELDVAPWLRERLAASFASSLWSRRLAGVGLLARLGIDAATDRAAWGRALRNGDETPEDRCVSFAQRCSAETLDALETLVLDRCGELSERLTELASLIEEPGEVAVREARAIVESRDELESWRVLLRAVGRTEIRDRVSALDALASTWATTLDWIGDVRLDGDHGAAVAMTSPHAWWVARMPE